VGNPLEGIARELANVAGKLDAHIEERASAKAAARIAEVEAATAALLAEASAAHEQDRVRWTDLEAEFRRQIAAADRVRDSLIRERDAARAAAESDRRATESAARWLAAAWALTKDTDGGDIHPDAEIPIGELRRVLLETRIPRCGDDRARRRSGRNLRAPRAEGDCGRLCGRTAVDG
jgi:hypothetical protein